MASDLVTLSVDGGIYLYIEATNPADYLRDIQITMPGGICDGDPFTHVLTAQDCGGGRFLSFADNSQSILFYPVFANRLRSYSVLRFMDWMATNGSLVASWSQRMRISYSTWTTGGGAPVEVMIALANLVQAHPWFNIPHQADDAYAQNFAQMVKDRLDPALSVYLEDSNEVWNSQFAQYAYAVNQAKAQTPAIDNIQYHALRSRKPLLAETKVYDNPPGGHTFDRRVNAKTWQPENTREQRDSWNRVWTFLDWHLDPFHDASTPTSSSGQ